MIKWGLVGLGDISRKRVAPAIQGQRDSCLYAAHSPFAEELEDFQRGFNVEKGFLELGEMMADSEIDAVYVNEINFGVGDSVKIIEGALKDSVGVVEEISPDKKKVKVFISFLGRQMSTEFDATSVAAIKS